MWYENLFAAFWILLQFIFWVGVIGLSALVVGAIIMGVWNNIQRSIKLSKEPDRKMLRNNAEAAAISRYRLKPESSHVTAFVEGADYMWEALHRKK